MNNEIRELNKEINNMKLANKGLAAEYQYVIQKKDDQIREERNSKLFYKKEFEEIVKKLEDLEKQLEEVKAENETIKNSRWWKLREKIKGGK